MFGTLKGHLGLCFLSDEVRLGLVESLLSGPTDGLKLKYPRANLLLRSQATSLIAVLEARSSG